MISGLTSTRAALAIAAALASSIQPNEGRASERLLADPAEMLSNATRVDFSGSNRMSVEQFIGHRRLRSVPQRSATGLYLPIADDRAKLKDVRWSWRVDRLQPSADLRSLEHEDVAAAVIFVFGEPTLFSRDVPTLAYVWTGTAIPMGSTLRSRRYNSLKYIKLRGTDHVGTWHTEVRDIAADYRNTFGKEPGALKYVAVFNDNDQTGEPASALFGPIFTTPAGPTGIE